ncbi:MAG: 3-mercaptopyruvate sulfurtransferase [Planctomycetota bacterium]
MTEAVPHLVSCQWLKDHLNQPDIRVVDMRGYVVTRQIEQGVDQADYKGAYLEYLQGHIPGSTYIDWTNHIVDLNDPVPAQIAPPDKFTEAIRSRGINSDSHVIAVDHAGGQFATRLWWALKYYGHDRVSVLDGGYIRWHELDLPLEEGVAQSCEHGNFTPNLRSSLRMTAQELGQRLQDPDLQIVDARDSAQYSGAKRRGSRGGHIPGAISLPREKFLAEGGGFEPVEQLTSLIEEKNISKNKPVVAYCNGGVAATVVLFNLSRLGFTELANYDGSWNEWSERPELPAVLSEQKSHP